MTVKPSKPPARRKTAPPKTRPGAKPAGRQNPETPNPPDAPQPETPATPNKAGRPAVYTRELSDYVLHLHMSGLAIAEIGRRADTPAEATIHKWRALNVDGFAERYAAAREVWLEVLHEKALSIAMMEPRYTKNHVTGEERIDPGFETWRRSQLDQIKWLLARANPRKWGDRTIVDQTLTVSAERLPRATLEAIAARRGIVIDGTAIAIASPAIAAPEDDGEAEE